MNFSTTEEAKNLMRSVVQPINTHREEDVCANYLLDWMAHLVQRPHMVATPVLVLKGCEGSSNVTNAHAKMCTDTGIRDVVTHI